MRILVAEDDRATRMRIEAFLREWGHDPVSVADGEEAWELFQNEDLAFVITDWQMPRLSGIELIQRAREACAKTRFFYAILLTSRSEKEDVVRGIESGADDFITKPFDKDELRVRIRAGERILDLERSLADQNNVLEKANRKITASNKRMKKELASAAKIQQAFLPRELPDSERARFCWRYQPCDELGGDTLNIIPFDDHRIGLYLVDVSGHGVEAALLSVHLSRILTDFDARDPYLAKRDPGATDWTLEAPARVASRLNQAFTFDPSTQQYFTLLYGILDLDAGTLRYASAGHPGPLLVREGNAAHHPPTPPGVGLIPEAKFVEQTLSVVSGDRIFLYTDGLFEIANADGEDFGEQRLGEVAAESARRPLEESVTAVMDAIREWRGARGLADDLSLAVVEIV